MDQDGFLYYVEGFRDEMEDYVEEMDSRQGLSLSTPADVLTYVEEYGISSVRLWFTDMLGFLKSFSITPKELKRAFEEGMGFDGSSIEGYQRIQESDLLCPSRPPPRSFRSVLEGLAPSGCSRRSEIPTGPLTPPIPASFLKPNWLGCRTMGSTTCTSGPSPSSSTSRARKSH
jgi:hypothetical protein